MSDVDKVTEAVNNIAQAFSDLHGGAELREEIARLKAINAKLGGTAAKKTAEISELREANRKLSDDLDELREAQTRGGQAIELQRQHEEVRDLREELNFKEIEIKELKASLERQDKAAIQISRSNAHLRSEIYDVKCARDAYRQDGIELRDVLAEIRRAIDDHDDEED